MKGGKKRILFVQKWQEEQRLVAFISLMNRVCDISINSNHKLKLLFRLIFHLLAKLVFEKLYFDRKKHILVFLSASNEAAKRPCSST